jgi:hypothetical protein
MAEALERDVLPVTDPSAQHTVRVAVNLARLLAREVELATGADEAERSALAELVDRPDAPLADLVAQLSTELRGGTSEELERRACNVLVAVTRGDLAIAKPGYDRWKQG